MLNVSFRSVDFHDLCFVGADGDGGAGIVGVSLAGVVMALE